MRLGLLIKDSEYRDALAARLSSFDNDLFVNILNGTNKDSSQSLIVTDILPGEIDKDVNMYITPLHMLFEFENTIVVTRLIEGEYFQVERMISSDYSSKAQVNKRNLQDCIERASLLVRESDRRPTIMGISEGVMELSMQSQIGTMNEEIDISREGKDIEIGFNPRFMLDVLRVIDDEEISIYLVNPRSPFSIRSDDGTYTYVILPISFNSGI